MARLQLTGNVINGELESFDPDAQSGIQTKADADALRAAGPGYGAQINQNAGVMRLQVGAEAAEAAQAEAAQVRVDDYMAELDRIQAVASAGRTIDARTLENLVRRFNDTAIAYVRSGGTMDDGVLFELRQRVDSVSASARMNNKR